MAENSHAKKNKALKEAFEEAKLAAIEEEEEKRNKRAGVIGSESLAAMQAKAEESMTRRRLTLKVGRESVPPAQKEQERLKKLEEED